MVIKTGTVNDSREIMLISFSWQINFMYPGVDSITVYTNFLFYI